ncbi:MAG: hypothetical protein ABIR54_22300 [Burkholderiaceae bacterium]
MLVKALRLRRLGTRISAEELRAETPSLGNLRYEANPLQGRDGQGALTCLLMPLSKSTDPEVQLFHAKVRRIDGRGILIQGIEALWKRKHRTDYQQTLWAWPINPDDLKPAPMNPIDLEDEEVAMGIAMRGR